MEEIRKAYKLSSQNLKGRDISQGTSKDGETVLKKLRGKECTGLIWLRKRTSHGLFGM